MSSTCAAVCCVICMLSGPRRIPAQHRPISLPYSSLGTLFKGREAFLQQLRASLTKTTGKAAAIVGKTVHGLGGVGKTRLAVEYAWQHADAYSAVLFVTADSPANLQRNLAELAGPQVLNLLERESPEEAVQVAAALRWLEWASRLVADHLAASARWGDHVEPLELDVLAKEAIAAFLLERTTPQSGGRGQQLRPNDDQHAAVLAQELDGLALARSCGQALGRRATHRLRQRRGHGHPPGRGRQATYAKPSPR